MVTAHVKSDESLQKMDPAALDPATLKQDLKLTASAAIAVHPGQQPELDRRAEDFVKALVAVNPVDESARASAKNSVESIGYDLQKEAARQSEMLKQPLHALAKKSEDGGEVAKSLIDLKMQVEDLDPGSIALEAGWFSRTIGMIPGIGNPMKRYFSKYESAQTTIGAIIRSLENGRDQLKRDNITLSQDQKKMRELTIKIESTIKLGQLVDQKLDYMAERDFAADLAKQKFVKEELIFAVRQRLMDLQQQLAVNQQGVLATEIIIRNNQELVRGVERALNVTVSALQVAVTVAMALANQKIVLDKIAAINKTTSNLIAGTAQRLKTQGAEIHKQASTTTIDMEALKSAFIDINAAMEDISSFRSKALPQMANTILEMDKLTTQANESIVKMEKGNRAKPSINLEVL